MVPSFLLQGLPVGHPSPFPSIASGSGDTPWASGDGGRGGWLWAGGGWWAEPLRCKMPKLQPPLTPILESWQGTPRACDSLSASAPQLSGLASLGPSISTPAPPKPQGPRRLDAMATASLQPAGAASLWQPTFRLRPVKASPCSSISSWFPASAHVRQQVGCTRRIFWSPTERVRFVRVCATRHWPPRVCAGHAWVRGSVALGARWPASSRAALGSRGPGHPSSFPRRVPATWAARLSSMWAGGGGTLPRPLWPQALTRSSPAGGR